MSSTILRYKNAPCTITFDEIGCARADPFQIAAYIKPRSAGIYCFLSHFLGPTCYTPILSREKLAKIAANKRQQPQKLQVTHFTLTKKWHKSRIDRRCNFI